MTDKAAAIWALPCRPARFGCGSTFTPFLGFLAVSKAHSAVSGQAVFPAGCKAGAGPAISQLRRGRRPAQALGSHNRLRSRQPRNRYPEWRTGHVVEADLLAKRNRRRIATVLAANAKLDVWPRLPPTLHRDLDEFAHTIRIERNEGIGFENALGKIVAKERARIVAAQSISCLSEVVRAEGEEFGC